MADGGAFGEVLLAVVVADFFEGFLFGFSDFGVGGCAYPDSALPVAVWESDCGAFSVCSTACHYTLLGAVLGYFCYVL